MQDKSARWISNMDQLDGSAWQTSWTNQLDRPAGWTSSLYFKPWPVHILEHWPFSLYIVGASESDEGLVHKKNTFWIMKRDTFGLKMGIFTTNTDSIERLSQLIKKGFGSNKVWDWPRSVRVWLVPFSTNLPCKFKFWRGCHFDFVLSLNWTGTFCMQALNIPAINLSS